MVLRLFFLCSLMLWTGHLESSCAEHLSNTVHSESLAQTADVCGPTVNSSRASGLTEII